MAHARTRMREGTLPHRVKQSTQRQTTAKQKKEMRRTGAEGSPHAVCSHPPSQKAPSLATQSRPIMAASLAYAIGRTFG